MARIIAIESDTRRRRLLAMLIREYVKTELRIVESVAAAIDLIREKTPDLVLTPALLAPRDGATLIDFVKHIDAPYIQLLTIPALDMLVDQPKETPNGLRALVSGFGRRRVPLAPQYDRAMIGAQIVDGLARAREAREEYRAMLVRRVEVEELAKRPGPSFLITAADAADLTRADRRDVRRVAEVLRQASDEDRRISRRRALDEIPWLSAATLSGDIEIGLVNISSSGVLVETGSKLAPGSTTELHLTGPGGALVVPVRFIRSEIASVGALGVKYHAAGAFDRAIDLAGPRREQKPATPPAVLAQLLAAALAESDGAAGPAHVRFTQGVRELVGARDVQIRTALSSSAGRETLYFDVPGDDRARTTLQVVFDRSHDVTSSEFTLLRAAAWLTAAALEFDRSATTAAGPRGVPMLAERVA